MKGISVEVTEDQSTTQGPAPRPVTLSIVPELHTEWGQIGEGQEGGTPGAQVIVQAGTGLNIYPKVAELI